MKARSISWNMYVDESDARLNSYDMIIGRDLLHELVRNISPVQFRSHEMGQCNCSHERSLSTKR
jgi:hypothetical protein